MNDTWGAWFYRRPTNLPNQKKALREWLGGSDSIEIVNLKIPWGLWFYRCIFRKRVSVSRIITIKLSTPTLSLNSKGDVNYMSFSRRGGRTGWFGGGSAAGGAAPITFGYHRITTEGLRQGHGLALGRRPDLKAYTWQPGAGQATGQAIFAPCWPYWAYVGPICWPMLSHLGSYGWGHVWAIYVETILRWQCFGPGPPPGAKPRKNRCFVTSPRWNPLAAEGPETP